MITFGLVFVGAIVGAVICAAIGVAYAISFIVIAALSLTILCTVGVDALHAFDQWRITRRLKRTRSGLPLGRVITFEGRRR